MMESTSLPPGFRFHPTDEELVGYYLRRKTEGLEIELDVIPVIDLYKWDPWELPDKSFLPKRDMEWFFFCPRDKKYPNGSRTNRATKSGYWKATGKDRKVIVDSKLAGFRKTLVFYGGRAPLGDRTDWVMHEYRLCDDDDASSRAAPSFHGPFALCRVMKRKENSYKRDATFKQARTVPTSNNEALVISDDMPFQGGFGYNDNCCSSTLTSPYETSHSDESIILDSSKDFPQGRQGVCGYDLQGFQMPEEQNVCGYILPDDFPNVTLSQQNEILQCSSLSNFIEEVELSDQYGCMLPYSPHGRYGGLYTNEDSSNECYHQINNWTDDSFELETGNQPPCRQISGDVTFGEYNGLW